MYHTCYIPTPRHRPTARLIAKPVSEYWDTLGGADVMREILCSVEPPPKGNCFAVIDTKYDGHIIRRLNSQDLPGGSHSRAVVNLTPEGEVVDKRQVLAPYARGAILAMYLMNPINDRSKMLMIGLGGGVMPNFFAALNFPPFLDVVEIDPVSIAVAERWFDFGGYKTHLYNDDGILFLKERQNYEYDCVILDAAMYDKGSAFAAPLPFFRDNAGALVVKNNVKRQGMMIMNIISLVDVNVQAELKKLKDIYSNHFKHCFVLSASSNFILACTDEETFVPPTSEQEFKKRLGNIPRSVESLKSSDITLNQFS